jgi:hypothetical protein
MGQIGTKQIGTKPTFRLLNSAEAIQQLEVNNAYDNYDTACQQCRVNRVAAQRVEPCAAPSWARAAIDRTVLPAWLAEHLQGMEIKIAFFHEGLPHTREPDTIWLPAEMSDFQTTFIHELIHISQRRWPARWTTAYKTVWNMEPGWVPADLKGRLRLNPDTFGSVPYTWTAPSGAKWTPVLTFANLDAPRLTAVRLLFVNGGGGWQSTVPTEWIQTFRTGEPSICEHPHEMAAYTLSSGQDGPMATYLARLFDRI